MKAEQLRIGNRVLFRGKEDIVWRVEDNNYVTDNYGHGACDEDLEPIQLTEEWLCRFGFYNNSPDNWTKYGMFVDFKLETYKGSVYYIAKEIPCRKIVHYVHQLQNLYFALADQELSCNKYLKKRFV